MLTPYTFYEESLNITEVVLFPCSSYHRFLAASNIIFRPWTCLESDVHVDRSEKDGYLDNRSCKSRLLRVHLKSIFCFITVNEAASSIFPYQSEKWPSSFYSWPPTSSTSRAVTITPSSATPAGLFLQ